MNMEQLAFSTHVPPHWMWTNLRNGLGFEAWRCRMQNFNMDACYCLSCFKIWKQTSQFELSIDAWLLCGMISLFKRKVSITTYHYQGLNFDSQQSLFMWLFQEKWIPTSNGRKAFHTRERQTTAANIPLPYPGSTPTPPIGNFSEAHCLSISCERVFLLWIE